MDESEVARAVGASTSAASALGLKVNDAAVLQNSNRAAIRLTPCDVLARIAPVARQAGASFEVEVARRLADADSPLAELDPRVEPGVYVRDGFAVTLWTYYEPLSPASIAPAEYGHALTRLHSRMRQADLTDYWLETPDGRRWPPHFTDRVEEAQWLVAERDRTPELGDTDRELLSDTLQSMRRAITDRGAPEQLLHGEPHPGNVLRTHRGLLFVDLETCCRGPIEFDIAHTVIPQMDGLAGPEEVGSHYPAVDRDLLRECWLLMLAMVATWRWEPGDQLPNGRKMATEWLNQIRAAVGTS